MSKYMAEAGSLQMPGGIFTLRSFLFDISSTDPESCMIVAAACKLRVKMIETPYL